MAVREFARDHWWHLAVGIDVSLFVAAIGLWMAGRQSVAVLAWLVALVLPLSVVGGLLDGQ